MFGALGIRRYFGILETKPNSATMKTIIFALALVAIAAAGPVPVEKEPIKILRSEFVQEPAGSYSLSFESEDGISRNENGVVKEILDEENKPHSVVIVKGSYSYTNDLGKVETINYYADQTGYHPEGDSIPKPVEPVSRP